MKRRYPTIIFTEEVMREGMQIEDSRISAEDKIELLNALSETGLKTIVVGSFVSPKYTPQMKNIEAVVAGFTPKPGVTYAAVAFNQRGLERAEAFCPPVTVSAGWPNMPRLKVHLCDVFVRRNYNKSQMQEMEGWVPTVATARRNGASEAAICVNAVFGSNFLGEFDLGVAKAMFERQHALWDAAGIEVTTLTIGDPMGWAHPAKVEEIFSWVKSRWPAIKNFGAHLHNSRGMALASAYAAMRVLDESDTLHLEGTLGGVGGCPYCGNGQATGMMPTEDFMHMLEGMGIDTGVDMDKLIECVWLLERILGRQTWGHVSRAGPRPLGLPQVYDANMPFVETLEQATHFKRGPSAYQGGIVPWPEPISSPYLERLRCGQPAYELDGDWPWNESFFPSVDDLRLQGIEAR